MKEINVIGSLQLFAACQKAPKLRKLVMKSSTAVYGASPGDPALFTEDMSARGRCRATGTRRTPSRSSSTRGTSAGAGPMSSSPILRFANFMGSDIETTLDPVLLAADDPVADRVRPAAPVHPRGRRRGGAVPSHRARIIRASTTWPPTASCCCRRPSGSAGSCRCNGAACRSPRPWRRGSAVGSRRLPERPDPVPGVRPGGRQRPAQAVFGFTPRFTTRAGPGGVRAGAIGPGGSSPRERPTAGSMTFTRSCGERDRAARARSRRRADAGRGRAGMAQVIPFDRPAGRTGAGPRPSPAARAATAPDAKGSARVHQPPAGARAHRPVRGRSASRDPWISCLVG